MEESTTATQIMNNVLSLGDAEQKTADETTHVARPGLKQQIIEQQVVEALTTIYDPEIPVNIYELGLIYELTVDPHNVVDIKMTLTSPACPVAGTLPGEVEAKIREVPGVRDVHLELVWDPPYHPDMMSEEARLQLGFF